MQWFKMRPTFDMNVEVKADELKQLLLVEAKRIGDRDSFLMYGEYGELHLPKNEHRLWSPHLSFYLRPHGDTTVVHGRFAPRVDVWTSVWIAYLIAIFTSFFAAVFAYSQWMLNEYPWGVWLMALALLTLVAIYVVAHIGQQWSADQMLQLQRRLEGLLEAARTQACKECHAIEGQQLCSTAVS